MTVDDIALPSATRREAATSQQTAIEQARAVAEVAAQVRVAQDFPRDLDRAYTQMRRACATPALAARAFYSVPNRGTGNSVHLLRELARCFGNIQHGVVELRRDDAAGESEVQAWAWDVETNTRSVRSFIVPHAKMVGKGKAKARTVLEDLGDIINNNNSFGSRAVRETLSHVLPVDMIAEAARLCWETRQPKNAAEMQERVAASIANFARGSVTQGQLEKRVGRPSAEWDAEDVATLAVIWESLVRGETTKADEFPDDAEEPRTKVTADDITGDDYRPGGSTTSKLAEDKVETVHLPGDVEAQVAANDPALDLEGGA